MAVQTTHNGQVPLLALRSRTRTAISQLLNPTKVIPTTEGLPRDWRGLAHLAGVASPPCDSVDPTTCVLALWEKLTPCPSLAQLQQLLTQLDRWDILDDTASYIDEDAEEYVRRKESGVQDKQLVNLGSDSKVLTVDDVYRVEQGLEPQVYDAFLLYAEQDGEFAKQIVDRLETDYGLKLCLKERDLVGGVSFEHDAIMQLISERCNRLIIIVSPSFLESPVNKFFVTFAQALGIEQRQRKIVPCIYQRFPLPAQLRHYFILDYNRAGHFWDFWDKLSQSVTAPSLHPPGRAQIAPRCSVREIEEAVGEEDNADNARLEEERMKRLSLREGFLNKLLPPPSPKDPAKHKKNWFSKRKKKNKEPVSLTEP